MPKRTKTTRLYLQQYLLLLWIRFIRLLAILFPLQSGSVFYERAKLTGAQYKHRFIFTMDGNHRSYIFIGWSYNRFTGLSNYGTNLIADLIIAGKKFCIVGYSNSGQVIKWWSEWRSDIHIPTVFLFYTDVLHRKNVRRHKLTKLFHQCNPV